MDDEEGQTVTTVCSDLRKANLRFYGGAHYANIIAVFPYIFKVLPFEKRKTNDPPPLYHHYRHHETLLRQTEEMEGKVYELYHEGKLEKTCL